MKTQYTYQKGQIKRLTDRGFDIFNEVKKTLCNNHGIIISEKAINDGAILELALEVLLKQLKAERKDQ